MAICLQFDNAACENPCWVHIEDILLFIYAVLQVQKAAKILRLRAKATFSDKI